MRGVTRLVEARITAVPATAGAPREREPRIDRYDFGITAYRGLAARRLTVDLAVIAHREES